MMAQCPLCHKRGVLHVPGGNDVYRCTRCAPFQMTHTTIWVLEADPERYASQRRLLSGLSRWAKERGESPLRIPPIEEIDSWLETQGFGETEDFDVSLCLAGDEICGDLNCDGVTDNFDIDAFILAVNATQPNYPEYYAVYPNCNHLNGDCDGSGVLDNFDIDPFIAILNR